MTQAPAPDETSPGGLVSTRTAEPFSAPAPPAPVLLHSGTYAVYRTPAGGLHVTYRRESALDEDTGQWVAVDESDEHLPEMPPAIVAVLQKIAETGERPSPATLLKLLMGGDGPVAAMFGGGGGGAAEQV